MAWISAPEQGQHWQDSPSLPENSLPAYSGTIASGTEQVPETFSHLLFSMEQGIFPVAAESVLNAPVCPQEPLMGVSLSDELTAPREVDRLPGTLLPASTTVLSAPQASFVPPISGVFSVDAAHIPVGEPERFASLAVTATLPATRQEVAWETAGQQPVTPGDTRQAPHQPQAMETMTTIASMATPTTQATSMPGTGRDNASVAGQHQASVAPAQPPIAVASQPEPVATDASQRPAATTPTHQVSSAYQPQTERLQAALGARLQMHIANRTQTAHIRLDPPALGKIDIHLHLEQGQLQVALHAQHEDVARALRLVSHGLQEQLAADTTQRVSVQISTGHGHSPRQPQDERTHHHSDESTPGAGVLTRQASETQQDSTILLTI
ncbi:flagellar hook-length control protein FliK [Mangrovibacter phragmitis]|uniref:flagellar hook-length control protein FliK n=1 Tax=Mangrovibacter phragmitis TaxID=1691903 RepID=UPI0035123DE6